MAEDKRASMREALLKKTQHSYEHRDDSGQFKDIFVDSPELKKWKCKAGEHLIDIIPYIAGPRDPNTKEGEWTYVLILWVHYGVGINQDGYVCPARNYNLPCPICEYREELRKQEDYDEELVKSLNPKKRSIYNVIVLDSEKEREKGIQIFDVAHWFMEKHLVSQAKIPVRPGEKVVMPYVPFSDLEEGKTVSFERKGEKKNSEFLSHKFIDRSYTYPIEYAEAAYQLDAWIVIADYDEIKAAFYGSEEDDVLPEAETAAEAPPAAAPAPPPLKPRASATPTPAAAPAPAPTAGPKRPLTPTPASTPAPAPEAQQPSNEVASTEENQCPAGGVYGSCEQYEECNGCVVWDDCSQIADQAAAAQTAAPASASTPTPAKPTPKPAAPAARPTPAAPKPAAPAAAGRPAPRPLPSRPGPKK